MGFGLKSQRSTQSHLTVSESHTSIDCQQSSTDTIGGSGSHRCLAVLQGHEGHVFSIALAGKMLYSGSECGDIRAWKLPATQKSMKFGRGEGSVKALAVVGERVFSAHQDQKIRVWRRSRIEPSVHKLVSILPTVKNYLVSCLPPKNYVRVRRHKKTLWIDHHDAISVLAVGNGVLYSGSWDKTVKVWRLSDLKCLESINAHSDAVNALVVDQQTGFLYSGSADSQVKVWERGSTSLSLVAVLEAHSSSINALALSPDGSILYSGSSDKTIRVLKRDGTPSKHMKPVGVLRGHRLAVLCLTALGNLLISGSADKTVRVWRRGADGLHSCVNAIQGHKGPVKCLCASTDTTNAGTLVYSGSMDGEIRVWVLLPQDTDDTSQDEFLSPLESPVLLRGGNTLTLERRQNFP